MGKVEHSPGPWHASHEPGTMQTHGWAIFYREKDGQYPNVFHHGETELSKANATLMAAAPDLLEACKLLLMCSLPRDVSGRDMVDKAHAAIAKAEGRKAISLLEVLIAVSVLSIGLLAVAMALIPAKANLSDADKADHAVMCGQTGLADATIRGILAPALWRDVTCSELGVPKPVPAGTQYADSTRNYPWQESYVIDPLYVATRENARLLGTEPTVLPAHYADFPYRPEQPGSPVFGEAWTRLRRVTSTAGGGFDPIAVEHTVRWQGDTIFACETDESRPEQLFQRVGFQELQVATAGRYTWLFTVTPTPEPLHFVADTPEGPAAFGEHKQLFHVSVVVLHRRDLSPPGKHAPSEPPPERQVQLEFLGDGYGGGDVRLSVLGDPADASTWQPTEYLADVRKNGWMMVSGRKVVHKHYVNLEGVTAEWVQTIGVHYWYRIVNVVEIVEDGSPPWLEATLAGPDWHSDWSVDLNGDGQSNEAVATLCDGAVGVFTSLRTLRSPSVR